MKLKKFLYLCGLIVTPILVNAQAVLINNDIWSGKIFVNELMEPVTEAGEDYLSSTDEDDHAKFYISVIYPEIFHGNKKWHIDISKNDYNWHPDISIQVKRIGKGDRILPKQHDGSVWGGDNYQEVSNNPTFFFKGKHSTLSIPVSVKFSGLSLTMGAKRYETNLVITVYDRW